MSVHEFAEPRSAGSRVGRLLTWLGGGHWRELGERHERSTHAVAGAVVLAGAVLAWFVATLVVSDCTRWPMAAVVPSALVFAVLVGAVTRAVAGGHDRGRPGMAGRAAVAAAVGVVVGDLAALAVFSGSIDSQLDERALRNADSAPAVVQASAALQRTLEARRGLDNAVEQARADQDKALVTARCEYNPSPACPPTRITGVPGPGPETRTANELLADAQRELDAALAARDRQTPGLDATIYGQEQTLAAARRSVIADAGRGLGARWAAMNGLTLASPGALLLRLLTIGFFVLVYLLPLVLRMWRGETTHERRAAARAEQERAELEADTAIAVKRAEVRREAEIMWAEHRLTQARLAIEAQTEIDREQQRRRVVEALDAPVRAESRRTLEAVEEAAVEEDIYLPIAAAAEAASRAAAALPAGAEPPGGDPEHLPALSEPEGEVEPQHERGMPLLPSIPRAVPAGFARWIRPLVPPVVARVIDTTTQPLRTARQVFEEVEEITFALKRTHKVTVDSETFDARPSRHSPGADRPDREQATRRQPDELVGGHRRPAALHRAAADDAGGKPELTGPEGPPELEPPAGPPQLPPSK